MKNLTLFLLIAVFCLSINPTHSEQNFTFLVTIDQILHYHKLRVAEELEIPVAESGISYVDSYFEKNKESMIEYMAEYKIPASFKLAQAMLESNYGRSALARTDNNHYGITATKHPLIIGTRKRKDMYSDVYLRFAVYETASNSHKHHCEFLTEHWRYKDIEPTLEPDPEYWASEIKKRGYATDKKYVEKIMFIINKYDLRRLDNYVLSHPFLFEEYAKDLS